ncbi:MAG: 3-isopropylmalate dehydratase [Candidatus Omnitrophica bacterium]|nr:3-isopropylmalate dehydratase [Candidatus Omnitrophota bacterium]
MKFEGQVFKFGDNINTDFIISGRYKFSITDMKKLSIHLFEDIRPDFYQEIIPDKSIIVGGENFGLGSSREQAPWVIKEAKVLCVIAKSFARIFYRNSFNIGLALIEADTDLLEEKDHIVVNLDKGTITNLTRKKDIKFPPFEKFRKDFIKNKGVIRYLKKYKNFKIEDI